MAVKPETSGLPGCLAAFLACLTCLLLFLDVMADRREERETWADIDDLRDAVTQ